MNVAMMSPPAILVKKAHAPCMSKAWSKACKERAVTTSRKDHRAQTKSGGTRHMAPSQRHMHRWQGTSVETQTQTGSNRASMNIYGFYVQSNIYRDPKKGHPPPNSIWGIPTSSRIPQPRTPPDCRDREGPKDTGCHQPARLGTPWDIRDAICLPEPGSVPRAGDAIWLSRAETNSRWSGAAYGRQDR